MRTCGGQHGNEDQDCVSIPFKREGTCEPDKHGNEVRIRPIKFQFPSNGKAHANLGLMVYFLVNHQSFNSLQTGRHMRTQCHAVSDSTAEVSIPFKREGTCEQRRP